jgi:beta-galactosidase
VLETGKKLMLTRFLLLMFALLLPQVAEAEGPRTYTDLNEAGWRFLYEEQSDAVTGATFDDSQWERVSVPHTWNRIGEYALTRGPATNNKQGVGYYRLTFNAPAAAKGRRQYLDFGAVAIIADVWVNGVHVGQHKGAYSRFRFDVTAAWKPGAPNLIVVKADNSKPAIGSTTEHVLPLAGDFFIHGGMYRGVSLITSDAFGFDLLDHGGPGLYVNVLRLKSGKPDAIAVRFRLANLDRRKRNASIHFVVRDHAGTIVARRDVPPTKYGWEPDSVDDGGYDIEIPNVRLWNGQTDPYQYTVTAELRDKSRLIDSVTQSFGIRSFKFDPNTGFTLNGKSLKLKGVSRHQDRLGKGYALSGEAHAEDMAIIKEMGANSVRQAHYQHADEWSDEADKAGMIVWAEVPFVTTPSFTGGEGSPELFANAEQQTRELIRQNYNHPSIVMWSVGNEVDAGALFGISKAPSKPRKLLDHIARIAREEDPSRPTIFADCCEERLAAAAARSANEAQKPDKLAGAADMIGYNRYYGWYTPEPLQAAKQLGEELDNMHVKHPTLPISISEYGAGGAIGQHSDNPTAGFVNATGRPQPEEYESWVHEQSWPVIRDRPFIFGSYVWNMFDFASDLRNEGDAVDINTKGLVTMDRKTKKDAFYYYKAQWTDKPMIYITGKRHRDRPYSVIEVKAYTTAKRASLTLNGRLIGDVACEDRICLWPSVTLKPGQNVAEVTLPDVRLVTDPNSSFDPDEPIYLTETAVFNGPDPAKDGIHLDAGDIAGRVLGPAVNTNLCGVVDCVALADKSIRLFGSDNFVRGGTPTLLNQSGFLGRGAPRKIVTAPDPVLYDYWREGEAFSYAIPVPDGKWTVTIHTFEPRTTGAPMMSVSANGKLALPPFNVAKAAGGALKGIARSYPVTVKGGVLKLDFSATGGKAVVAAIEVTK